MAKDVHTSPVRGMRDLLPAECELRDWAVGVILATYRRFGFQRVETPALEHLTLLTGGDGGENEKLIFKVLKRGDELRAGLAGLGLAVDERSENALVDAGLRFDLTVPLARYYAEHHAELPAPFKSIQIGPVWRAERPQKGRFRQFTQCDIDVVGEAGESAEIDLILATTEALGGLGLSGFTVRINDRRLLRALAAGLGVTAEGDQDRLFIALDKLDKVGAAGVLAEVETLGMGVDARGRLAALLNLGPGRETALQFLEADLALAEWTAPMRALLDSLEPLLRERGRIEFDPTLVRGMGYYTGPIFEIGVEGLPYSIAGGGRYDRMIGKLLGREVPACGFSIGFERVIALLLERGVKVPREGKLLALLHDAPGEAGAAPFADVVAEAARLRGEGHAVSLQAKRKKVGKQLDDLQKLGFDGAATLPVGGGAAQVKWFADRAAPESAP